MSRRARDESGAVAILVAVMALLIVMFAAYAVDIGLQINRKHQLNDTLDAAAQAGAYALPGSAANARTEALAFALAHDPTETGSLAPSIDFWCVVASKGTAPNYTVDTTQIPSTCYPGTTPYTPNVNYKATSRKITCSQTLCAIPCVEPLPNTGSPKVACNTIRVYQGRDVPFQFAPAGGIQKGGTGNLVSVACKGSCGTVAPNPMDVAIVADRTESMAVADVGAMVTGIKGMLQEMTPSQQYVALGTIGRSSASSTSQSGSCTSGQLTYPSSTVTTGKFVPISFSNDYLSSTGQPQGSSALVKGLTCIDDDSLRSPRETGTALAAPMKAAARYLLNLDSNNLSSLPVRTDPVTKVLIFETDGMPNERIDYTAANQFNRFVGSTSLSLSDEPFASQMSLGATGSPSTQSDTSEMVATNNGLTETTTVTHNKTITYTYNGGSKACQNFLDVAANAKAQGILVITIAYNLSGALCDEFDGIAPGYVDRTNYNAGSTTVNGPEADKSRTEQRCDNGGQNCKTYTIKTVYKTKTTTKHVTGSGAASVLNVLAQAASSKEGVAASASNSCSTDALRATENADGDYFFCAATGTQMAPIFKTALSQVSKGIKLIRMPQ